MSEISQFQGKPTICLNPESGYGKFSFGTAKAQLILENIAEIYNFVLENGDSSICDRFIQILEETDFTGESDGTEGLAAGDDLS